MSSGNITVTDLDKLNADAVSVIKESVLDCINLNISEEIIISIVENNATAEELDDFNSYVFGENLDSYSRDVILDIIAEYLGFDHYPIYADTIEYSDSFFQSLKNWGESINA